MKYHFVPVGVLVLLLAVVYLFPPRFVTEQPRTITVSGIAQTQKANEVAQFTAGVSAVNDDKQKAVSEVNTKVTELTNALKKFGIAAKDIKTQNLNIYQNQETYYEGGTQKQRLGQWNVSNNVEFTLRDINKTNELTTLLSESGANNVFGPNFSLDTKTGNDENLMKQAIADATVKAKAMAKNSGATLGKVMSVQEASSAQNPILYDAKGMGGGGGASLSTEPGSTTVSKSVVVTFELK